MCLIHSHSQQNERSAMLYFLPLICEPFSSHVFKPSISDIEDEEEKEYEGYDKNLSFSGDGVQSSREGVLNSDLSTYSTLPLV